MFRENESGKRRQGNPCATHQLSILFNLEIIINMEIFAYILYHNYHIIVLDLITIHYFGVEAKDTIFV